MNISIFYWVIIITDSDQGSIKLPVQLKDPLYILTIVTTIIAMALSAVQIMIGVNYFDVFTHLNVALQYSGLVIEGANMGAVPPLIPFLSSWYSGQDSCPVA